MLHHFLVINLNDACLNHLEFQVSSSVSFLTPMHVNISERHLRYIILKY